MRGVRETIEAVNYYTELVRTRTSIVIPKFYVKWDLRGTRSGEAWARKGFIRFNPILLDENPELFVKKTVPHEIAHLATRAKYGNAVKSHGNEWANIMRALGLPPVRCHNYDISTVTGRRHKSMAREIPLED